MLKNYKAYVETMQTQKSNIIFQLIITVFMNAK